jgi:hypothetical protein
MLLDSRRIQLYFRLSYYLHSFIRLCYRKQIRSWFSTWLFSRGQAKSEFDWVLMSPANQVAFFSVRANKFAWWKTGLKLPIVYLKKAQNHSMWARLDYLLFRFKSKVWSPENSLERIFPKVGWNNFAWKVYITRIKISKWGKPIVS